MYEVPSNDGVFINENLSTITLDNEDVFNVLVKLDKGKACGCDGIPTQVLKYCASALAPSITAMFNLSLSIGKIPKEWKSANVIPIHKKDNIHNVVNYRPISLLPIISKVLEKCIFKHIFKILRPHIDNNQHGFMPQHSATTQLLDFYNKVNCNIDNNLQTDIVFLDLSKAFDNVPHIRFIS